MMNSSFLVLNSYSTGHFLLRLNEDFAIMFYMT